MIASEPAHLVGIPKWCPRRNCGSFRLKFRYYNNNKKSQPRYLCRDCGNLFTLGGNFRPLVARIPIPAPALHFPLELRRRRSLRPRRIIHKAVSSNSPGHSELVPAMEPGHRSSQSSTPESTVEVVTPTVSFARIPLNISSGDTSSAESMLWEPALDASFRLPELSPFKAEAFQSSEDPDFDDCGMYQEFDDFGMQLHDTSMLADDCYERARA